MSALLAFFFGLFVFTSLASIDTIISKSPLSILMMLSATASGSLFVYFLSLACNL